MLKKQIFILAFAWLSVFLSGCDGYQKVLKSTDLEYKLTKAIEYYDDEKFAKAYPIFDELLTLYRGTSKAQDVYYYYAMTLFQMQDYLLAAYHFKTFYQTFPNHPNADDAAFMVGYAYFLDSPVYSLDQTNTYKAINEMQLYINTHPHSTHIDECNQHIDELRGKLERKSFEIAKQYWHTENYKAAVEALSATLNDFPDTPYREEALFLRLDAAYKLAKNSVVSLQPQRLKQTLTAYYELVTAFPETGYKKQADEIEKEANELLQNLNTNI